MNNTDSESSFEPSSDTATDSCDNSVDVDDGGEPQTTNDPEPRGPVNLYLDACAELSEGLARKKRRGGSIRSAILHFVKNVVV